MQADWYLVQLTADLRKHEPRNVGVVLRVGSTWILRFRGVERSGKLNGRQLRGLGVAKDTYKSWVDYFTRKASPAHWDEALTISKRLPSNFGVIPGGTILEVDGDPRFLADRLFSELVTLPEKPIQAPYDLARRLLADAHVEVNERIVLPGRWDAGGEQVDIPFDFGIGHSNRVTLEALSPNALSISYLRTRLDAIERAGVKPTVIAMLPLSRAEEASIDELLRPVEQHAHIVNLDASDAPEDLLAKIP